MSEKPILDRLDLIEKRLDKLDEILRLNKETNIALTGFMATVMALYQSPPVMMDASVANFAYTALKKLSERGEKLIPDKGVIK